MEHIRERITDSLMYISFGFLGILSVLAAIAIFCKAWEKLTNTLNPIDWVVSQHPYAVLSAVTCLLSYFIGRLICRKYFNF